MIHETYEIIYETLCDMESGSPPDRKVCTQAERFAAAVLMQPRAFEPLALEWGLDVLKLQQAFRCSYAAVSIRLAEVLRDPPLMVVLYAMEDGIDSKDRADSPDLRVKVVRRTRGFGTPTDFPICGERGGVPRWAGPYPPALWRRRPPATAPRASPWAAATPPSPGPSFVWEAARVVVIAVPESYASVLGPQMVASDMPGRRRKPVAAVGPW